MEKYKDSLEEFARHLKAAITAGDPVAIRALIEAFRDTCSQLDDEKQFGLYTQNPDKWEEVITYFGTHPELGDDSKNVLLALLEKTSKTPPPS